MNRTLLIRVSVLCVATAAGAACGDGDDPTRGRLDNDATGGTGSKPAISVGGGSTIPTTGGTSGSASKGGGGGNQNTGNTGPYVLPLGYTAAEEGGFMLGAPVTPDNEPDLGGDDQTGCGTTILGIVRDFKRGDKQGGHADFETFKGEGQTGIVMNDLGKDDKPVYNPSAPKTFTTSQANFDQWYNDVEGINDPYYVFFSLEPGNDGLARFTSRAFFPLDGKGFGNQGFGHNFGFTTEVHTTFRYNGGESFSFTGDDDLWVFINEQLAIDLGGLHESQTKSIKLDEQSKKLGIVKGSVYQLDLFHAERHSEASNFNIVSNLSFVDCGVIVPSGPVK